MEHFYKELKQLREEREISLEEISDRTKIHIQYLYAIEKGDFNIIETPYLRLFLRAYTEEIGGDSTRSLEQLDSFMGTTRATVRKKIISNQLLDAESSTESDLLSSFLPKDKKKRQEYIKGAIFSIVFIFAIIISQKIFKDESSAILTNDGPIIQKIVTPLTHSFLLQNYFVDQSSEELLNVQAPFFIKIKTLEQVAYTFIIDSTQNNSKILNANMEQDLESFISTAEIILNSTKSVSMYINGTEIENITNYKNPMRLIIKPNPPSVAIQRYKRLP